MNWTNRQLTPAKSVGDYNLDPPDDEDEDSEAGARKEAREIDAYEDRMNDLAEYRMSV